MLQLYFESLLILQICLAMTRLISWEQQLWSDALFWILFFTSLNITFLPEHNQNEEYVGEIFPDGQTQSIPQSPVILSTNFDLSPKILMFTFQQLKCSSKGRYRIIAGGTNSSVAASVETFELNVLGMLNPMTAKNKCIVGV